MKAAGAPRSGEVAFYFGTLTLANALGDPTGLLSLPILFVLKDDIHLGPQALAMFEAVTFIPVYFGFLFGFLRDRWRPFGWGDRGYFLIAAPLAIGCYLWLAAGAVSYGALLGAMLLAMVSYQMLDTALESLMTAVAQRYLMTGRLSAVAEMSEAVPGIVAVLAGGWMASHVSLQKTALLAAAFTAVILLQAFWMPGPFLAAHARTLPAAENSRAAIVRLLRHGPLWPTAAILLLWDFSPGWGTPLFYYLTEHVRVSSEVVSLCRAVTLGCVLLVAPFYGYACQRLSLKRSLWLAVVINILPGLLFLLITNAMQAVAISAVVGLPQAFGHVALFDLLRRACPKELEGTGVMIGFSAFALAGSAGDIFGAWLYEHSGMAACLIVDALTNALILLILARLPVSLVSSPEGICAEPFPTRA